MKIYSKTLEPIKERLSDILIETEKEDDRNTGIKLSE